MRSSFSQKCGFVCGTNPPKAVAKILAVMPLLAPISRRFPARVKRPVKILYGAASIHYAAACATSLIAMQRAVFFSTLPPM
jgi:hypothetical protein